MRFSADLLRATFASLLVLAADQARALPIGFGVNQGEHEYSERKSENFYVYHDKRTPEEGAMVLSALEAAKPHLEGWFGVARKRPLPVIVSAVSSNASFANFVTDAIELQTRGLGTRDLVWHEYTHSTMYRTLDNILGPAGSIIPLFMMPAWFLEGLAESTSASVGSDVLAGIERYQALTGDWPTYDRLHSLYTAGFAGRGYATSGAFVQYVLRQGDPNKLPKLMEDFNDYAMPWWWPWSALPFNDFLPLDAALETYAGKSAKDLWEQYKRDAKAYWEKRAKGPFLVNAPGNRRYFSTTAGLKSRGDSIIYLTKVDGGIWETELVFDATSGFAVDFEKKKELPDDFDSFARISGKKLWATVVRDEDLAGNVSSEIRVHVPGKPDKTLVRRKTNIVDLVETPKEFVWLEYDLSVSRICGFHKTKGIGKERVRCFKEATIPKTLTFLGGKRISPSSNIYETLWFGETEETLQGDRYAFQIYDARSDTWMRRSTGTNGKPLVVAFAGEDLWLLAAERNTRTIRKIAPDGACLGVFDVQDHVLDIQGLASGDLVLGLYAGNYRLIARIPKAKLTTRPCHDADSHTSPLLESLRAAQPLDFKTALARASLWTEGPKPLSEQETRALLAAKPIDRALEDLPGKFDDAPTEAAWRGRPVFAFPWIGADDAMGLQYGVVSVPLMDHMQNEEVRLTALYGWPSRFPYQELMLRSTRFYPDLALALYRQQTWNGRVLIRSTNEIQSLYYDEKGGKATADVAYKVAGGVLSLGASLKYAHFKPWIGPSNMARGFLLEPGAEIGYRRRFFETFSWSLGLQGRVAPEAVNEQWDYNQLATSMNLTWATPLWGSVALIGVEGSRTRGKKPFILQESYRPLKTFVPGSGGGYNKNSFPLFGGEGGLFSPRFGNTQARAKANWTVPLVRNFDQLLWVIYLERLDFTAFYNYGDAWYGAEPPRGWDHLLRAHGYSLDMQMENKGVRFNAGIGAGQVIERDWQIYLTTGFDALF